MALLGADGKAVGKLSAQDLANSYEIQVRALMMWLSDKKLREFLINEHYMTAQELAIVGGALDLFRRTGFRVISQDELRRHLLVLMSSWKFRKIISIGCYNREIARGRQISIKEAMLELREYRKALEAAVETDSALVLVGGN